MAEQAEKKWADSRPTTASSAGSKQSQGSKSQALRDATSLSWVDLSLQILIVFVPLCVIGILASIALMQSNSSKNASQHLYDALTDSETLHSVSEHLRQEALYTCTWISEKHKGGSSVAGATALLRKKRSESDIAFAQARTVWESNPRLPPYADFKARMNDQRVKANDDHAVCEDLLGSSTEGDSIQLSAYSGLIETIVHSILKSFGDTEEGLTCQLVGSLETTIMVHKHIESQLHLGEAGSVDALMGFGVDIVEHNGVDSWVADIDKKHHNTIQYWQDLELAIKYGNKSDGDPNFYNDGNWDTVMTKLTEFIDEMKITTEDKLLARLIDRESSFNMQFYGIIAGTTIVFLLIPALAITYGVYALGQRRKVVEIGRVMRERSDLFQQEERKTAQLLNQLLPKAVTDSIRAGVMVQPESFDEVTVLQMDIVGFTPLCSRSTPLQVVAVLNTFFTAIDSILDMHDCYKVETVGDAVVVASGVPVRNGNDHSKEIANIALDLLLAICQCELPHIEGEHPLVRIGMHTGPCTAGVVGIKTPKYTLLGECVETAASMESNSTAMRIQMTEKCHAHLSMNHAEFETEERGDIVLKGTVVQKGKDPHTVKTFWLIGRPDHPYRVDEYHIQEMVANTTYNQKPGQETKSLRSNSNAGSKASRRSVVPSIASGVKPAPLQD